MSGTWPPAGLPSARSGRWERLTVGVRRRLGLLSGQVAQAEAAAQTSVLDALDSIGAGVDELAATLGKAQGDLSAAQAQLAGLGGLLRSLQESVAAQGARLTHLERRVTALESAYG